MIQQPPDHVPLSRCLDWSNQTPNNSRFLQNLGTNPEKAPDASPRQGEHLAIHTLRHVSREIGGTSLVLHRRMRLIDQSLHQRRRISPYALALWWKSQCKIC